MTTIAKLNAYNDRVRELFEQKFTRADWENKVKGTRSYFAKCQEQASREIFSGPKN